MPITSALLTPIVVASALAIPSFSGAESESSFVIQEGHLGLEGDVTAATFSADGRLLLTAGAADFNAVLWDVTTARQIRSFRRHTLFVRAVDLSPDSRWALTGSDDGTASLWDVSTGIETAMFDVGFKVEIVKLSHDGSHAVLGGESGTATLVDLKTRTEVCHLGTGDGEISSVAFSPTDAIVALSGDRNLELFSVSGGECVRRYVVPDGAKSRLQYSPNGIELYGLGSDSVVRVWAAQNGALARSIPVPGPIAISMDAALIVGLDGDRGNVLVSATTGQILRRYLRTLATNAAFLPDPSQFLGVSVANGVALYSSDSGQALRRFSSMTHRIMGASISESGRYLAMGGGLIGLWDFETGRQVRTFGGREETVSAVSLSPDGQELLTGSLSGDIRQWVTARGQEVLINPTRLGVEIKALSHSKSGLDWLVQTYYRDAVLIRHDTFGNPAGGTIFPGSAGYAAALSGDGNLVVTSYGREDAMIWNSRTVRRVHLLGDTSAKPSTVRSAAFSRDGRYVATGSYDGSARVWRVRDGKRVSILERHANPVTAVAISEDDKYVLTGSGLMSGGDNTARLWDVATGKERFRLDGHSAAIRTVAFLPHKKILVTASEDGSVRLWSQSSGKELCRLLSLSGSHWIVVTPDGVFDTDNLDDLHVGQLVSKRAPLSPVPLERVLPSQYEPRLLPRILAGEPLAASPPQAESIQYQAKIVQIAHDPPSDLVTVTVRVTVESTHMVENGGNQLADVRLFRDGQLVGIQESGRASQLLPDQSRSGAGASASSDWTGEYVFRGIRLPASATTRRPRFSCYALNNLGIKGETDRRIITLPPAERPRRGTAYVIAIGVSEYHNPAWRLHWAAADARAMAQTLSSLIESSARYDRVVPLALTSERASLENRTTKAVIHSIFKVLAGDRKSIPDLIGVQNAGELRELRPEDMLLVTFSGHGYRSSSGKYFIVPYDAGQQGSASLEQGSLDRESISTDELGEWLRGVSAGNITLIIDACHSGAAFQGPGFKPGPMGSRGLGQLAYDKGMQILAASQPEGPAEESSSFKLGVLTYALVRDAPHHASESGHAVEDMSLRQWFEYAAERVPTLYKEKIAKPGARSNGPRSRRKRDVVVEAEPVQPSADVQRPGIFDYSTRSEQLVIIPGFRAEYRRAAEDAMLEAAAAQGRGGQDGLDQGLQKYVEAQSWYHEAEDYDGWALACERASAILLSRGDSAKALEQLRSADALYDRAGAKDARAHVLAKLADIHYADSLEASLETFSQALELARREGDLDLVSSLLSRLSRVYGEAGELAIAEAYRKLIAAAEKN